MLGSIAGSGAGFGAGFGAGSGLARALLVAVSPGIASARPGGVSGGADNTAQPDVAVAGRPLIVAPEIAAAYVPVAGAALVCPFGVLAFAWSRCTGKFVSGGFLAGLAFR